MMLWQGDRSNTDTLRDIRHEERSVIRDIPKDITIVFPYETVNLGVRGVSSNITLVTASLAAAKNGNL